MALLNKVLLKNPSLSNFDLSRKNRTTMAPGLLYPVLIEECVPGDQINLQIDSLIKTYPMLAPLMGSFKFQTDVFFVPTRLYVPELRLNQSNFDPTTVSFPYFNCCYDQAGSPASSTAVAASESSLLNYMGIPYDYAYTTESGVQLAQNFNGIPLLGYLDIFRNYYANTQEDLCYFQVMNAAGDNVYRLGSALSEIDDLINMFSDDSNKDINSAVNTIAVTSSVNGMKSIFNPQLPLSGLLCKTYSPDLNSAWINTSDYDASVTKARVNVQDSVSGSDYVTMNQIRTGNKLLKYLERTLVSGGRFGDWIRAQFGVNTNYKLDIPEFLGSNSTDIIFDDVVQTSGATGSSSTNGNLGTLGGRGHGLMRSRGHKFNVTENGYLMVIASLTPRVDYYQGIKPYLLKNMYSDCFAPAMDNLGFQTVPYCQLSALPKWTLSLNSSTGAYTQSAMYPSSAYDPFTMSAGYQPAWTEYMSSVNELHGDFVNTLNYWTLGRDMSDRGLYEDTLSSIPLLPTSYVFPEYYNDCFADTADTAQNFLVQFRFDLFMKRPISKQVMPTL